VARRLRAAGHDVFAPTLTGQGERAHLFSLEVGLDTHVHDVVAVMGLEDCAEVVLVGHGYGGVVITAVAEEVPSRLGSLVYVDALVPFDDRSTFDLLPVDVRDGGESGEVRPDSDQLRIGPSVRLRKVRPAL
jgi:pimeloyl-ACP methyl ester carboxylesterase